jgi:hypothetical protein
VSASVNRTNDPYIFGEGREAVIVYADAGGENGVAHVSIVFDPAAPGASSAALKALAEAGLDALLAVRAWEESRRGERGEG